jgi:ABC-type glycerol-3-phosphate transport system permease component
MSAGYCIFLKNNIYAFQRMKILNGIEISAIITVISVSLILITAPSSGYFQIRNKWKTNATLFASFLVILIEPYQALMILPDKFHRSMKPLPSIGFLIT